MARQKGHDKGFYIMESAAPVTLYCRSARLPEMITRLTTYLLEQQYGFMQTCYTPEHADFDVFDAEQRPIVQLTVKATNDTQALSEAQALPISSPLAPDAAQLLQHLLQLAG